MTNSKFDAMSRPLIERLGWKTIDKLIVEESNTVVYKSLNGLAHNFNAVFSLGTPMVKSVPYGIRQQILGYLKKSLNGQRCFSYRGGKTME